MKRLSQWLCAAAFISPGVALAADPTGGAGTQSLPPATSASAPADSAAPGKPAPVPATTGQTPAPCCVPKPCWASNCCAPKPCCPSTCCPTDCAPKVPCLTNTCGDSGCGCEHPGGIIGGVGMYWIQPYFSNNPSYAVISAPAGLNATAPTSTVSHLDVSHNMDVSPEIWLGYIGDNGFGFRARWWYYRQDTSQSIGFNASPLSGDDPTSAVFSASPLGVSLVADNGAGPLSFNATTKLQLQVWDVEALQDIQVGGFDLLFSGGLRFAHINQEYDAFAIEPGATMPRSSVTSSNSFDGLGPVIDLEARRAIGNTGIALYGCARGALLFGSAHQTAFGTNVIDGGNVNASDSHDRVMPVGELELGLEYSQRIGNARIFGQMALVGQDWLGAGNASRSNTFNFAGVPDGGTTTDSDLGFFGLAFRLGVNY